MQGSKQPTAYNGPFGESMFPAVSVHQSAGVRVNLGREPFFAQPPEGYLPVEVHYTLRVCAHFFIVFLGTTSCP